MSGHVKLGLILGAAILGATAMWIYFGAHQTCIRAYMAVNKDLTRENAEFLCVTNRR
jgi:hypothetical protein